MELDVPEQHDAAASDNITVREQAQRTLALLHESFNPARRDSTTAREPIGPAPPAAGHGSTSVRTSKRKQPADKAAFASLTTDGKLDALFDLLGEMRDDIAKLHTTVCKQSEDIAAIRRQQAEQAKQLEDLQAAQAADHQQMLHVAGQLSYTTQRCDWLQHTVQMQLEAADRRRRMELTNVVVLKPADSFSGGLVAFGKLDEAAITQEVKKVVELPEGSTCTILRKYCERPPAASPDQPRPPAPVYQTGRDYRVERIEVRLPDGVHGKVLHGNRQARVTFEQRTHMLVSPALTEMEQQEKQHLQQHAMKALIDHNLSPGWRRSKITWKVPGTEKFGLLTMADIPTGSTPDFVLQQWTRASQVAAPGAEVPNPTRLQGHAREHGGPVDAAMA